VIFVLFVAVPFRCGCGSILHVELVIHVFGFDFQLFLTRFADPVVLAVNEGMIVDAFAVVFGTQIAFHGMRF
jgi:hypothetical protein